jgi:hypothetical protein
MTTHENGTAEVPLAAYVTAAERDLLRARATELDTSVSKLIRALVQREVLEHREHGLKYRGVPVPAGVLRDWDCPEGSNWRGGVDEVLDGGSRD